MPLATSTICHNNERVSKVFFVLLSIVKYLLKAANYRRFFTSSKMTRSDKDF